MSLKKNVSRRQFLGQAPCLAVGTATLYSSLLNLRTVQSLIGSTSMAGGDYKALVCILLSGGNDSFNMLVPRGTTEYNQYAQVRSNQALPLSSLLPINPLDANGTEFGLHPSLVQVQQLFDQGNLAFISNVGTLVEPTTKGGIQGQTARLPLGLLSHSDQVMHWQTCIPQDRTDVGWGGRMADIIKGMNSTEEVSMNISLGGNNIFQRGDEIVPYAINNTGGVAIQGWNLPDPFLLQMKQDINSMLNKQYEDVFKDSYRGVLRRSIDSNELFNDAISMVPDFSSPFSPSNFSQDLRMVAQSIAARDLLGFKRQIFFVQIGGFDNHDELLNNHGNLMETLDAGLAEFYAVLEELDLVDCVTAYTISDFGRTLTSNGNGTDHAWGGNTLVMGGAVKGQKIYGQYPELALNTDLELGGGIFIPTTSADSYFAELALWFGISPNDLHLILPNISNFYSVGGGDAPIGYLL